MEEQKHGCLFNCISSSWVLLLCEHRSKNTFLILMNKFDPHCLDICSVLCECFVCLDFLCLYGPYCCCICFRNIGLSLIIKLSWSKTTWEFQVVFNILSAHENHNSTKRKTYFDSNLNIVKRLVRLLSYKNGSFWKNLDLVSTFVVLKQWWQYTYSR